MNGAVIFDQTNHAFAIRYFSRRDNNKPSAPNGASRLPWRLPRKILSIVY